MLEHCHVTVAMVACSDDGSLDCQVNLIGPETVRMRLGPLIMILREDLNVPRSILCWG